MRTTVTIEDELLKRAKREAVETGRTLSAVLEDALRVSLMPRAAPNEELQLQLVTFGDGGTRPGVDLDNNAALLDLMDAAE